jgi:hypothetical protein
MLRLSLLVLSLVACAAATRTAAAQADTTRVLVPDSMAVLQVRLTDRFTIAGAGWGFQWGGGVSTVENALVLVLGGETRVGRHVKLLAEHWIFTSGAGGFTLLSGTVRFTGGRLSAAPGLIGAAEQGVGCCLPW